MLPFEGPALVVGAGATTLGGGLMIGGGIATTIG